VRGHALAERVADARLARRCGRVRVEDERPCGGGADDVIVDDGVLVEREAPPRLVVDLLERLEG